MDSSLKKKIIAIIPARSGSRGLRNKNIKLLGGHPLLGWAISACRKSKLIDYILVSTDSKKYANIAKKYRAEVPFLRPNNISKSLSTNYEMVNHALVELSKIKINPYILVHINPTTPLRDPKIIDKAIKIFLGKRNKFNSLRTVHEMSETAYKTFEIKNKKFLKPLEKKIKYLDKVNMPRQCFKKTYAANGIVDIYSVDFIRKNKMLLGSKVFAFITPYTTEVDNINDFEYLKYQVKKNKKILRTIF